MPADVIKDSFQSSDPNKKRPGKRHRDKSEQTAYSKGISLRSVTPLYTQLKLFTCIY